MTTRIVMLKYANPTTLGDTGAPNGYIELEPTRRRDVDDTVVLPSSFNVRYGEALMDGDTEVRPATDGIAWAQCEITDDTWGWTYTERTNRGHQGTFLLPAGDDDVPLTELAHVNPTTFAPVTDPIDAWQTALNDAIEAAVASLVADAPDALDTLKELADALGDDPNFATTIATTLANKQPLDADLTAIAALVTTAYGRGLLTLADAAALKAALNLPSDTAGDITGLDGRLDTAEGTLAALPATYVPLWKASTAYTAGQIVRDSYGFSVKRIANGTSGASYDATEAALWVETVGRVTLTRFGAVGDNSTDDTNAVKAAVAAAKAQVLPIHGSGATYKLTDTIDARCTVAGASQSDDFKGIIGVGREATKFIQYTNNIPIFRFSGRYFDVKGFTAKYATAQTTAHTAGNVFDFEDWIYFCEFDDLLIENGYIGWNSKDGDKTDVGSGVFSNEFSNIRFLNNRYVHLRESATGGVTAGGTGNHWANIYMSSPEIDRMYRAVERFGGFEDVWNQLNIEQTIFEDCAFYDSAGDSLTLNALHVEGCKFICGSGSRAIVATNGKGRVKVDIGIDECFFGPHKVSGITRSGSTATATIDLLGKTLAGHGLRVGDTIVVAGANETEYNVTATVTAVPSTTTVQYTVSGTPTTPATLAASTDYISMALGADVGAAGIEVVKAITGAEIIELDARIRDVRVTGRSASARSTTFRFASAQETNARVKLRNLSTRGQLANAHLPMAIDIVALSRASNVATAYTRVPHRLRVGDSVFVSTGLSGYQLARTVVAVTGPHTFTYSSTGSDAAVARATSSALLMKTYGTTFRSRTSNVATLTIGAHSLVVGMRIRYANSSGYTGTDLVISAVTATTISYVNTGADEATTADTGGVVMALDAGISLQFLTEPASGLILEEADWLYSGCEALDVGTVNAGAAATQTTTHYGVRAGDQIDWTPMANIPDGLTLQAVATAADTIVWRIYNPTGSNIVSGVNLIRYQLVRS